MSLYSLYCHLLPPLVICSASCTPSLLLVNSNTKSMAPKRKPFSPTPIPIGNCEITVEAKNFTCERDSSGLQISLPRSGKINISVAKDVVENNSNDSRNFKSQDRVYEFVLVNPKDVESISKSYLQEVLQMYMTELPGMNYAANTGKQSKFLERCVTNGKYRTLLLKSSSVENSAKVVAAITYQIIPADTQYAEIPLAAVSAMCQRKGLGHLLFLELHRRLQSVGIRSIFCWGDKESEGFWLKQGFISIAEVDAKGRARKLPLKADIRKALCFPGGSTLMVCHLRKEFMAGAANSICLPPELHRKTLTPTIPENEQLELSGDLHIDLNFSNRSTYRIENTENNQLHVLVKDRFSREYDKLSGFESCHSKHSCRDIVPFARTDDTLAAGAEVSKDEIDADMKYCSHSTKGAKRAWEASFSSLKSKRVKGSHLVDDRLDSSWEIISEADGTRSCFAGCSPGTSRGKSFVENLHGDSMINTENNAEKCNNVDYIPSEAPIIKELALAEQCFRIMLMNIADEVKRTHLTKVIQGLGGTVTSDGSVATHVVTGKVRKTLNFCAALCSGAWVVSSSWLKESFRAGRFQDELPYILNDEDYLLKYRSDLKSAVLRAKASPRALFKGYNVCIAAHVEPPAKTLSAIVRSAGGNVICGLEKVNEASTTIFVASEKDMEEAIIAAKKGMRTFSSEWLMNCVMRQELDLEAFKFAESL